MSVFGALLTRPQDSSAAMLADDGSAEQSSSTMRLRLDGAFETCLFIERTGLKLVYLSNVSD